MRQATINLYSFNELSEQAKEKAIIDHSDFLESVLTDYEDEFGDIKNSYIRPTEDEAIESIEINEYIFFQNGELANCTHYVGGHPKAGITEFNFNGTIYDITK